MPVREESSSDDDAHAPRDAASKRALTVLLVDDHAVVRTGYRNLLSRDGRIRVVGEAADTATALAAFMRLAPDVVVMDIALPDGNGIDTARAMLAHRPGARVLVFSMYEDAIYAKRALQAGALGYLSKSSGPDELVAGVLAVGRGERYLGRDVAQRVALLAPAMHADAESQPSARQLEVLRLLAQGVPARDVAAKLGMTEKTVANHQWVIRRKLGASNPVQMVQLAARKGWIAHADLAVEPAGESRDGKAKS